MKNLVIAFFLNFGVFFFFLINPNNIFSDYVVNWVFWITGVLSVIFFVLVLDSVADKNQKIISLQGKISALVKKDEEFSSGLKELQKQTQICEEINCVLGKKADNISAMYPDHSYGALK